MCPGSRRRWRFMPRTFSTSTTSVTMSGLPQSMTCEERADSSSPAARSSPSDRDRLGNAAGQRARVALAAHERHRPELVLVGGADPLDRLAVDQLLGMPDCVHQDHLSEVLPGRLGPEHGQVRADSGSRGEQPEVIGVRDLAEHEVARGARGEEDDVHRLEAREPRAQGPFGNQVVAELVGLLARGVDERVRPRHELARHRQRELRELSGLERAEIAVDLEREEPLGPGVLRDDGAFDPLRHGLSAGETARARAIRAPPRAARGGRCGG